MNQVLRDKKAIALFIVPCLLVYSVFVILPILWSAYYSLFDGMPGMKWEFTGLSNYAKLFKDKNFVQSLRRQHAVREHRDVRPGGPGASYGLDVQILAQKIRLHGPDHRILPGGAAHRGGGAAVFQNL